ncbi:hypothetical protein EW026_g4893 [Hermanssonia centrifuga]|uniref:GH16 domain-containing protein n=1 Tax=Hermanssonia centrifuga TaxID=98765 RepID=A0A4S4KK91_9APHY|nr:hypothetical protein EW026_g4893 [Hermanssonia centrifuga]
MPQPQPQPAVSQSSYVPRAEREETAHRVATGQIGGGYGPYSYNPTAQSGPYSVSRFSNAPSEVSVVTSREKAGTAPMVSHTNTVPPYMWDTKDPDLDDALHNPDPIRDKALDRSFTLFSARGWMNASALFILVGGLLVLFAGYPIIHWAQSPKAVGPGFNLGGTNGSGQVPKLPHLPTLIDLATPESVKSRTGADGKTYNLVFSDEFETEGRTFWPGDDPYWEAVNLNYWPLVTLNGMTLRRSRQKMGNLSLLWTKRQSPTSASAVYAWLTYGAGLWPGVWTMGNLGRAGYGATTEGMWPYSYAACDVGTFPNQSLNGAPAAAVTGGAGGSQISFLPGQRVSACTCDGSDHPGPNVGTGRGVPEIDVLEQQVDVSTMTGEVSQSFQVAPYNLNYEFDNSTDATTIYDDSITIFNSYKGGPYQQAVSAVTSIDSNNYNNVGYATYGYEWWSDPNNRDDGYVTWSSQGKESWTMTSKTIGADPVTQVSQRLIPEEPMYMIFNLGMSPSFQHQDFKHLVFPSKMYIEYVRVYQRSDAFETGITCNPASHPTTDYINAHMNAYTNPNLTTWDQAGYTFPRNSLYDGC